MQKNYRRTLIACYLGFITQAIAANFAPLLFLKLHTDYGVSLGRIALIPSAFFLTQLVVDLICATLLGRQIEDVRSPAFWLTASINAVCCLSSYFLYRWSKRKKGIA